MRGSENWRRNGLSWNPSVQNSRVLATSYRAVSANWPRNTAGRSNIRRLVSTS